MQLGIFLKDKDEIQTLQAVVLQGCLITQILNSVRVELEKKNKQP